MPAILLLAVAYADNLVELARFLLLNKPSTTMACFLILLQNLITFDHVVEIASQLQLVVYRSLLITLHLNGSALLLIGSRSIMPLDFQRIYPKTSQFENASSCRKSEILFS